MVPYNVTFAMPPEILQGVAKGVYEVVGGVVRQVTNKQVVMWLRPGLGKVAKVATGRPAIAGGAALGAVPVVAATVAVIAVAAAIGYLGYKLGQYFTDGGKDGESASSAVSPTPTGGASAPSPQMPPHSRRPLTHLTDDPILAKALAMEDEDDPSTPAPRAEAKPTHPSNGAA